MVETGYVCPFEGANTLGRTASEWPLRRYGQHVTAYASRNLSYEDDIERAFAGIRVALTASMGNTRIWFGLPASAFDWAILWSESDVGSLVRRAGFPSWTWMGWKGYITMAMDHWSEFDQMWLRERTWVDWYIVHDGAIVPVWDPDRDRTEIWPEDPEPTDTESDNSVEEQSLCPQYGRPAKDNMYGRAATKHFDFLNRYGSSKRSPLGFDIPTPSDFPYLCFSTLSSTYNIEPATFLPDSYDHLKSSNAYFALKDDRDDVCGLVKLHKHREPQISGSKEVVQVLILSYAAPGTAQVFPLERLDAPQSRHSGLVGRDEDGENIYGECHSWYILNILVVLPQEG